ncbi:MAG TPA: ATP-dependent sacrificial sulfur transferase LarE [Candidatus Acidoferrum sp.]|nr:ATP-dependent sacrificial sulfur transferase LarE [Candidatus Acidoferrum sp.]
MSSVIQIRLDESSSPASLDEKQSQLLANLAKLPSLIVALSGGADSAYLAWAAHQSLGERALSVTAISPSYSKYDRDQLTAFLQLFSIRHQFAETHEMENASYRANAGDRCYFCKDELFAVLDRLAAAQNISAVAYGVNADDTLDFRPGHKAAAEHKVLAPLLDVRLRKSEIRALSRRANLPTWDRPASACLASRLPYGTEVTPERLALIDRAEAALRDLGFRQFRVRLHDKLARVEIAPDELPRALTPAMAAAINARLKSAGFLYVSLDLEGYRQGSLNAAL